MNTASEVLVIIVSAVLAVFLIVLIVAICYAISILKQVKRISARAENVADSVENAAANFQRSASTFGIIKIIAKMVDQTYKYNKKRKD